MIRLCVFMVTQRNDFPAEQMIKGLHSLLPSDRKFIEIQPVSSKRGGTITHLYSDSAFILIISEKHGSKSI